MAGLILSRRKPRGLHMFTYTVQAGDTLSAIGARYGESYQQIASDSGISDPNIISAGETLNIDGGSSQSPTSLPTAAGTTTSNPITSPSSSGSTQSSSGSSPGSSSSGSGSGGGLGNVPGVPSGFASCVAFHESTNGTNAAYNGGVYGIITASGINVNGQSLDAQKQAFSQLYAQYGTKPWAGDGCA